MVFNVLHVENFKQESRMIFIATTWGMAKSYSYLKKKYPLSKMIVVAHGLEVTRLKEGKELTSFKNVVNDSDLILCVSKLQK